jgi:uncharacterized protein
MANRLARATSPYLLQHRDNPVDWWEWGEEAFEEARRRDVPVLLSVGYAACHWCHVMAHESFEDPETASLMNRLFVNVKVDREERPDVDSVYMEAVQAMTGHGGWPMTVFIDHEGRPFFAGTYFPKWPHHGMPTLTQILTAVSSAWRERRPDVEEQAANLLSAISGVIPGGALPDETTLEAAFAAIGNSFDPLNGGFGNAPKFPQQPILEFLLRSLGRSWADGADRMLTTTLESMAAGGIHDQIGGGFARYSVDDRWLVPHFEKMLYDNAQLARIYLWAGIELARPELVTVARTTLGYISRDLRHRDGGFFSSEDADSEGVEGKFYVWDIEEIREVLGDDADPVISYYGVTRHGNFEGSNILSVVGADAPAGLDRLKARLLRARESRIRPGLDDKVVASWNGMAIRAFAEAGAALGDRDLLDMASRAARFVLDNLVVDGVLTRSWREGRSSVTGFLDDHASLALGFYSLYAATGDETWYRAGGDMVGRFERFARAEGGFYSTPADGESLVKRPFDVTDNPHPSGNAMAAEALMLTALYTGEARWRESAESALSAAGALMERYPSMVGHHLSVSASSSRTKELAIVGEDWERLARVHFARFRPHVVLAPSVGGHSQVPLLEGRGVGDTAMAYVCEGFVCDLPTSDPVVLAGLLG